MTSGIARKLISATTINAPDLIYRAENSGSGSGGRISCMFATNVSEHDVQLYLFLVSPDVFSTEISDALLFGTTVKAFETLTLLEQKPLFLPAGWKVVAFASSSASLNVTLSIE